MYQLTQGTTVLFEGATFDVVWRMTVAHYGHLTLKEFHDREMRIGKA